MKFQSLAALFCAVGLPSFFLPTFALAGDIVVTTSKDVVSTDGECSLREAVSFVTANTKPKGGKDGTATQNKDCLPEGGDATSRILVNSKEVYELTKEIEIGASMTIEADNVFGVSDENANQQPVISNKTGRIFVIDDKSAFNLNTQVSLVGLTLNGIQAGKQGTPQNSPVSNGGLIFNREQLILNKVKLVGGVASEGGAIFSASADANLSVTLSEFLNNHADQGAGIYSEMPNIQVKNTVFAYNGQLNPSNQGFVVYTQEVNKPNTIPCNPSNACDTAPSENDFYRFATKVVSNSIFFANKTGALLLKPSMWANNVTVINNDRGVLFDTVFDVENKQGRQVIAAQLSNSIALGNSAYDIKTSAQDMSFINHLLADNLIGVDVNDNTKAEQVFDIGLTQEQLSGLLASDTKEVDGVAQEVCRKPTMGETTGLFCPLVKLKDEYTLSLRPRLLMSYTTLGKFALNETPKTESPIVNKAAGLLAIGNNPRAVACETKDIRDEGRDLCDLGAFELKIVKDSGSGVGANDTITFGEVAYPNLKDSLGDGQLVPAAFCESYFQDSGLSDRIPNDASQWPSGTVGTWVDGCLLFEEGKYPKKGQLSVGGVDGTLVYTPDSNWHGYDEFIYRVVTTTSRFSSSPSSKVIKVSSRVLQNPPDNFKGDTIDLGYDETGSGSTGLISLFALLMLGAGAAFVSQKERYKN